MTGRMVRGEWAVVCYWMGKALKPITILEPIFLLILGLLTLLWISYAFQSDDGGPMLLFILLFWGALGLGYCGIAS